MRFHQWLLHLLIPFVFILSCSNLMKKTYSVGYIIINDELSSEDQAVLKWLEDHERFVPIQVNTRGEKQIPTSVDILWLHLPDAEAYDQWSRSSNNLTNLQALLKKGLPVLLTNHAALIPFDSGLESSKPELRSLNIKNDGIFDQRGLQSWRGHPVFEGMHGGAYLWDSFKDHTLNQVGYFGDRFPENGKVIGVEKSFVRLHSDSRLMFEYENDTTQILSMGSFVHFSKKNRLDANLKRVIQNSLAYLASDWRRSSATDWINEFQESVRIEVSTSRIKPDIKRIWSDLPESGPVFTKTNPMNQDYDLAGRRSLVMGKTDGGIQELWVHPVRILRDFETGIVSGDSIAWLKHMDFRIEIRPESISRFYTTPWGELKEVLFASMDKAGAVAHFESVESREIQLAVRFRCDLRWMWPYDEKALGNLSYGYDQQLEALHVHDETQDFYCIFGGDVEADQHEEGPFDTISWNGQFQGRGSSENIWHAALYTLDSDNSFCLQMVMAGSDQGEKETLSHYRQILRNPSGEYENTVTHYQRLLNNKVIIESPDETFNHLWKWALVGADRFVTETPGLGTALTAGFATTERGWDGGHSVNGRPGYGWYFGRDAAWSAFALNDYGDFQSVRQQLEFFQKFQDPSGKIFHELSTSGVVHYDAADATPLYCILAAHYLRASGDIRFIKKSWPFIKKAADFLYTTDTDEDGLIENTNQGHGWVEGGNLWGAHTTFYLAGLWAQTLNDLAYMSGLLDASDLVTRYQEDAARVEGILNTDFWHESSQFFKYGKLANGRFNREKTVLPAVVMYFGLLDHEKADPVLQAYAGNRFTTDWGVRILGSDSPLFNPRGYHYGSVWPLFTGWTALAEYEYNHPVQGFTHIWNNMMIKNHWALGFVEEVMDGSVYRPSGVCPHQCWSETNILHPGITGMVGWKPSAPENRVIWKPRFPVHWKSVDVRNLSAGKSRVDFKMIRSRNQTHYEFSRQGGKNLTIHLHPEILPGMILEEVSVNGQTVPVNSESGGDSLNPVVTFILEKTARVIVKHHNGVQMVPLMPEPKPNATSLGYRIINSRYVEDTFVIDLEGKSNTEGVFSLRLFDRKIMRIYGGKVQHVSPSGLVTFSVPFAYSNKPFLKKQITITFMK